MSTMLGVLSGLLQGEIVYPTFDDALSINSSVVLSNGDLTATHTSTGGRNACANVTIPASGKWAFEVTIDANNESMVGVWTYDAGVSAGAAYNGTGLFYNNGGQKFVNGTPSAYGASFTTGDVIVVEIDTDANTLIFKKNGASQGSISYDATGMTPTFTKGTSSGAGEATIDFGQNGFTPAAGYSVLTL